MRVRGQSPILWRRVGQSQLGAEPGHAVVIDGLSPQEQQLLDLGIVVSDREEAEKD